eukprot:195310-Prorocentrum_minimum.AAC.1
MTSCRQGNFYPRTAPGWRLRRSRLRSGATSSFPLTASKDSSHPSTHRKPLSARSSTPGLMYSASRADFHHPRRTAAASFTICERRRIGAFGASAPSDPPSELSSPNFRVRLFEGRGGLISVRVEPYQGEATGEPPDLADGPPIHLSGPATSHPATRIESLGLARYRDPR